MRIVCVVFLFVSVRLAAQAPDATFNAAAVESLENMLASDAMRGRATFTPDIERAADSIELQFRAAGLQTWNGSSSYRQPFTMIRAKLLSISGSLGGVPLTADNTVIISSAEHIQISDSSQYKIGQIKAGDDLRSVAQKVVAAKGNHVFFVDTSFAKVFPRLSRLAGQQFGSPYTNVFVLGEGNFGSHYSFGLTADQQITKSDLANVVGILPGKGKLAGEYVIFSGHYDHLGVRKPDTRGDSIYNGANDDASG
ncbi:MAG TPA: M28 family peptidase, partial [Puia sp.]|nr:M28 family peptidase [Puia sp.]